MAVRGSVVLCTDSGPARMPLLSAGRTYSAGKGAWGGGGALALALCALYTPCALMSGGRPSDCPQVSAQAAVPPPPTLYKLRKSPKLIRSPHLL